MTLAVDIGGYIEKEKGNWRTEFFAEGEAKGIAKGKAEERRKIAMRLLQQDLSVEQIVDATGLTVEEVRELCRRQ